MAKDRYRKMCYLAPIDAARAKKLKGRKAELEKFLDNPLHETGLQHYWHAIHYLLTGEAEGGEEPLCYVLEGGDIIGASGDGAVRYLSPDLVAAFSEALSDLPPDEFGDDTYDPDELQSAGIYPEHWIDEAEEEDLLGAIRECYAYLQDALAMARKDGKGVLFYFRDEAVFGDDDAYEDDDEEELDADRDGDDDYRGRFGDDER